MKKTALARDDRKRQIKLAFVVEIQEGRTGEMTIADIARHIHQTPSTKLREMTYELVIEGDLVYRDEPIPGVAKYRRIYSPNPKTFKRPKTGYKGDSKRTITINRRQQSFFEVIE